MIPRIDGAPAPKHLGVIGQDVLRSFAAYTMDFRSMRFTVERNRGSTTCH